MHVVGTAGHIDHGKSTLIRALTGMDPDRLKEEKERGMTIDLGFAWVELPSGRAAGIVDVPGHHRFVKNMLAGVGGINLTLFVVAANESWMPQSREHLAIVDLLGIEQGIVVLTKADLVEEDWLEMVREEVREQLVGTSLAEAPMVAVSAESGAGIPELMQLMDEALATVPPAHDIGRARLWIDRVFSIRGAGTVVTGTLTGGQLRVDQEVEILPQGLSTRIRGLQTHKQAVEQAPPGTRVAVNLVGLEREDLARGQVVVVPGQHQPTHVCNTKLRVLADLDWELPERFQANVYVGSAEVPAHLRLLGVAEVLPGETAYAQISLEEPTVLEFGDRFVLRDPTRQETVGGGRVLDPRAEPVRGQRLRMVGARRRLAPALGGGGPRYLNLELLAARSEATPQELIPILLHERPFVTKGSLPFDVPLPLETIQARLSELAAGQEAVVLPSFALSPQRWDALVEAVGKVLGEYHQEYPLRVGMARETLRTTMGLDARFFDEAVAEMARRGAVKVMEASLSLPDHQVGFTPDQEMVVARLHEVLAADRYSPPTWDDLIGDHGFDQELLVAMAGRGQLVRIGKGLVYPQEVLEEIWERVRSHIETHGSVDVGGVRDMLGTSRKYALPLLEYFDQENRTRRVGDKRVLGSKAG